MRMEWTRECVRVCEYLNICLTLESHSLPLSLCLAPGLSVIALLMAIFLVKLNHLCCMKTNGKRKFIVRNKAHHKFCSARPQCVWCRAYWEDSISACVPAFIVRCTCVGVYVYSTTHAHCFTPFILFWVLKRCLRSWLLCATLIPTIHYTFKIHRRFHTEPCSPNAVAQSWSFARAIFFPPAITFACVQFFDRILIKGEWIPPARKKDCDVALKLFNRSIPSLIPFKAKLFHFCSNNKNNNSDSDSTCLSPIPPHICQIRIATLTRSNFDVAALCAQLFSAVGSEALNRSNGLVSVKWLLCQLRLKKIKTIIFTEN